jgi:5-methylcytosine-specific restriction enzyme subunit McrC
MNRLFEEFTGRITRRAMRDSGLSVTLQGPKNYALSEIKSNQERFMTKPDIVIHDGDKPVMVIDTKWKRLTGRIDDPNRGVLQSDVYQMMAYAQIYQVKRLMLLYPHHTEVGADEGLICEHKVTGTDGVRLTIATISLLDLDQISSRIKSIIERSGLIP